jgi:hypothetical protein
MSAPGRFTAQLAHAGWAVLSWVGDTVSGRRALAQERVAHQSTKNHLSQQLGMNALLLAELRRGKAGGAE